MKRWRKLVCAAVGCSSLVVLAPPGAVAGPSGAFFIVSCRFSHSAPDDPIVFPRLPSHSHDHTFIGNVSTNAFTNPASLAGHATTCSDTDDLSSYWAPTLYAAGTPVKPLEVTIYYRRLTQVSVRPFPRGLEMVAGNSHALTPQNPSVTEWYCGVLKSSFYAPLARTDAATAARRPEVPSVSAAGLPHCTGGTNLELQVNFPDCSDGHSTSADHRSHMAYSVNGRCPESHPIAVPAISIILRYPPVTGSNVFLSSGGIYSGHADFMDGWKATPFAELVQSCLDRYVNCSAAASAALDIQ
jgi:Domain of unknown function (DUF1996)